MMRWDAMTGIFKRMSYERDATPASEVWGGRPTRIQRSVVLCTGDYFGIEHLPQEPCAWTERVRSLEKNPLSKFLKVEPKDIPELSAMKAAMDKIVEEYKEQLEERLYRKTLAETAGNLSEAARRLGVNKGSFFRTIKKLEGLDE